MTVSDSPVIDIPPNLLREARTRLSLSLDEAAELCEKLTAAPAGTCASLGKWESGSIPVTLEVAELLSDLYLVPFTAWFQEKLPVDPVLDFRKRPGTQKLAYESRRQLAGFDRAYTTVQRALVTLGELEEASTPILPTAPRHEGEDDPERLGALMRRALDLTDDIQLQWANQDAAQSELRRLIEAAGVFVFEMPFPLYDIRAAARWDDAGPAAILLNSSDAPAARMFSLLHEYAHLARRATANATLICDPSEATTDRNSILSEERMANRAAAAALVPSTLLDLVLPSNLPAGAFDSWPSQLRSRVRNTFHVSQEVIGIRLFQLKRTPAPRWHPIWRKRQEDARGRSLPGTERIKRRLGMRGSDVVRRALNARAVSAAEVARSLGVRASDISLALEL